VFEIHSPADWADLASTYPSGHSPIDPDWAEVANDWDGVHLSRGGLVTAQDVAYALDNDTTELRGWDMESTAWLRWSFASVERLDSH
jgi:hypothetical protein